MSTVSSKVWASTLASAVIVLICWGASLAGVTVPIEAVGALTVIATFLAGYIKTDPKRV